MSAAPGPIVIERQPLNASTPPADLLLDLTPAPSFFVRNHFPVPALDPAAWRLTVDGGTNVPRRILDLAQIQKCPARELVVTFECAGNGRRRLEPVVPGVQWDDTAVGTARWLGTPLAPILEEVGVPPEAVEVLFVGADRGQEGGRSMAFERSLPLQEALRRDVLLAYAMNGEPLPPDHGAPLRLLVPGWYGVASVKWLMGIRFLDRPFEGWFQRDRYVYRDADGRVKGPVGRMLPKALIVSPAEGGRVPAGQPIEVAGLAWAGASALDRVEVSTDGGTAWTTAGLEDAPPNAARRFRFLWTPDRPGDHELRARAVDADGVRQPDEPEWNAHGYGVNGVVPHRVHAAPEP